MNFWQGVQDFTNVQDVIDNYETKVNNEFLGWSHYKTVLLPFTPQDALSDLQSYSDSQS